MNRYISKMVKNNTGTDIDVGTKTDSENTLPINFQPLPKRFMVWDTKSRKWLHGDALREFIECNMQHPEDNAEEDIYEMYVGGACKIVQSTNLFDKDGKEIFEGHLVRWNEDVGIVEQYNGKWTFHIVTPAFAVYHELGPNSDMVKAIGHVLSNPELVEDAHA